jgi:carbon-monoxide dehydrogenase medium subunit
MLRLSRNVATIGGNVAHALPAGDGSIALLALDAKAEIASENGRRWESIESLFVAPGVASFDPREEILLGFEFACSNEGERTSFKRVMRPQGVAIAILNMGIWINQTSEGLIQDIRVAVGPAGKTPLRARRTEEVLKGNILSDAIVTKAIGELQDEAKLRTSPHRATKAYRNLLLQVLMSRHLSPMDEA